jgi:hypothetical protein
MAEITSDKAQVSSFAYLTTLDEILLIAIRHLEEVRRAPNLLDQKFNLSMASRAIRCALEIYRDRAQQEEVK